MIDNLRRAAKALAGRNPTLAPILIAQAGLGSLDADERVAFRLFAAERLLDTGLAPRDLMKGLGLDPWPLDALAKYSPNQPRVPAGNPGGGDWTSGDGGAGSSDAEVAANDPAKWLECLEDCHQILDRNWSYRWSDINRYDFLKCMNECMAKPS